MKNPIAAKLKVREHLGRYESKWNEEAFSLSLEKSQGIIFRHHSVSLKGAQQFSRTHLLMCPKKKLIMVMQVWFWWFKSYINIYKYVKMCFKKIISTPSQVPFKRIEEWKHSYSFGILVVHLTIILYPQPGSKCRIIPTTYLFYHRVW